MFICYHGIIVAKKLFINEKIIKMNSKKIFAAFILFGFFLMSQSCLTFYERSAKFHEYVAEGKFEKADSWIEKDKKYSRKNHEILKILNRGYLQRMMGEYNESIALLNDADLQIEDYRKNLGKEALALVSNPMMKPYRVEDFESVMLHYYQALNYYQLGKYDDAIVECRRMNLVLQQIDDKFKDHKNKYQKDAFGHLLMGIIYEAAGKLNDAFIAYRNAYEIYTNEYAKLFEFVVPEQLKKDLLRTSYKLGFGSEYKHYAKEFNMEYIKQDSYAELVYFWENGFGPVKDQWSIFFSTHINNGVFYLANEELGLFFNFYIGDESAERKKAYQNMSVVYVAFPKYKERKPVFSSAYVEVDGKKYTLDECENVNDIAFESLNDRMVREVSVAIGRLVTKKIIEATIQSQDEILGLVASIGNAVTEKADTRNWQTLPYSISYTRVPLKKEKTPLTFVAQGAYGGADTQTMEIYAKKNQTVIQFFHSLASEMY